MRSVKKCFEEFQLSPIFHALPSTFSRLFRQKKRAVTPSSSPNVYLFGDALLSEQIITADQLQQALRMQSEKLKKDGTAVRFGEMVVSLGYATEEEIVRAINRHYKISAKTLSDNIEDMIIKSRLSSTGTISLRHPPIMIKLLVAVLFIIGCTTLPLSYFVIDREQEQLYRQTVQLGKVSLAYFSNSAKLPLINDDILGLNALIKESSTVEGIVYTLIIDNKGIIKAHTDFNKIGTPYNRITAAEDVSTEADLTYYHYMTPAGEKILNLSKPVIFKSKKLGEIHVGISLDFIQRQIRHETYFMTILTILITILGVILAAMLGINFSRSIKKLANAMREIGRGNFDHYVDIPRKDEFGNLAVAFNYMSYELKLKSRLQETFGRYISPAILKMILADPDKTWLKGTRSKVSILFTDIRGFTSYSETTEPEKIVEALNEYFAIATTFILDNGGYVDKFIGDAVLGVFGTPIPQKNHTEKAIRAAVGMQHELQKAAKHGNDILAKIGMGINSGIVISGNLGSQVKMEYSIIGDSVNVASRLSELAGPGEIIISKSVRESTKHIVTTEALPRQKIKGKKQLIESYRVIDLIDEHREESEFE